MKKTTDSQTISKPDELTELTAKCEVLMILLGYTKTSPSVVEYVNKRGFKQFNTLDKPSLELALKGFEASLKRRRSEELNELCACTRLLEKSDLSWDSPLLISWMNESGCQPGKIPVEKLKELREWFE